jgi:peptidoglycan hydrolase-like protein with peptidoglycan-binding domain
VRGHRRLGLPAALGGAAVAGAVATVAVTGGSQASRAAYSAPRLATATVVRTNLVTSVLTEGTLGYAPSRPVVNAVAGTYTWVPASGQTIAPGRALYRVDNEPVVLMKGAIPAWRSFGLGMTAGPDVWELQANLVAEHFATGLLTTPTGQFDPATADAVGRWQAAHGFTVTGGIPLGQVVFLPAAVRVGALAVADGQAAEAGQPPYAVTTDRRVVTVPLNPDLPPVSVGQRVTIVLPAGTRTPGRVTSIGPPPAEVTASGGQASAQAGTIQLTVAPARPRATGTGGPVPVQVSLALQSLHAVLAVPVSALLALAGGGYGLEVVLPSGGHHLLGVRTGVFASGLVQISGPGISPGLTVVVAQ